MVMVMVEVRVGVKVRGGVVVGVRVAPISKAKYSYAKGLNAL